MSAEVLPKYPWSNANDYPIKLECAHYILNWLLFEEINTVEDWGTLRWLMQLHRRAPLLAELSVDDHARFQAVRTSWQVTHKASR